jgi:hypothetical protein
MNLNLSSEEVDSFLKAMDSLIELKILIRKSTPNYQLNEKLSKEFLTLLRDLKGFLTPLFSKYLTETYLEKETESIQEKVNKITSLSKARDLILVSSNSAKNILKSQGIDPRDIVVSGGPLFIEDYKIVNPQIPDKALLSVKKKCNRILEELKSKDLSDKELYFIYERENIGDSLILNKISRVEKLINKRVKTIALSSWDNLA